MRKIINRKCCRFEIFQLPALEVPDCVILRGDLRSSVDVSLELEAVQNLLLNSEVFSAASDNNCEPLVGLGRRVVTLNGARSDLRINSAKHHRGWHKLN